MKKLIKFFKRHGEILFVFALFVLFLTTRLYQLSQTAIYPDEITWMVRAKETALAIKTHNFKYFDTAWWTNKTDTEAIAIPLTVISGYPLIYLGRDQSVVSRNILQDYIAGRGPVIIFSAIFIVIYYFFVKKYCNKKVAMISSVLLTLDPIFTANSKLVMNDIFITVFTFISVSAYLFIKNRRLSIITSSLALAAAFLTKPGGIVILPVFFLQIFLNHKEWREELSKFLWTIVFSFTFISLFWPASWHNLLLAIPEYIFRETTLVGAGINNYFLGQITTNPPFYYYLFELLVRTPPIIILGLLFFIYNCIVRKNINGFRKKWSVFAFLLLFLASISFSAKKLGVRYELPVWPWIYMIASYSIVLIIEKVRIHWLRITIVAGIFAWFAFIFISFFPYHNLYYNFFIGGPKNSRKYDLVGLCEGSKGAVDYALKCFPEIHQIGAIGCGNSTIPYYYPYSFSGNWNDQKLFTVEAYYIQLYLARDPALNEYISKNTPAYTFAPNGVVMSYVYVKPGVANKCLGQLK